MGIYGWRNSYYNNEHRTNNKYKNNSQLNQKNQDNNLVKIRYPKCFSCSSTILITKIDIINSTIDLKCEECFREKKNETINDFINYDFYLDNRNHLEKNVKFIIKIIHIFVKHVFDIIVKIVLKRQNIQNINFMIYKKIKLVI